MVWVGSGGERRVLANGRGVASGGAHAQVNALRSAESIDNFSKVVIASIRVLPNS